MPYPVLTRPRPHRRRCQRPIAEPVESRLLLSTYTVTNLNDSGPGSLRDAIQQANAHAGPDTINFASGLSGTITLTSGLLELTDTTGQTSVVGPAANLLSVSGNNAGRVLLVDAGASASIAGLTIQSGAAATATGGGILNNGTLALDACEVRSNTARDGGGVYNTGMLTVTATTFSDNSATSSTGGGGAIETAGGTVTLLNSTFSGNTSGAGGGAIQTTGTLTINDCTIDGNTAQSGGGIAIKGGNTSAFNTIVAGNSTPGRFASDVFGNFDAHLSTGAARSAYNLIGSGGSGGLVEGTNGNLVGRLLLGIEPLGSHGGTTDTMPLDVNSPALNAGSNALLPPALQSDQRGYVRIINNRVDIGAYEYESAPAATPLLVNTTTNGDYVPGQLTFLQALYLANAISGPHTITFDPAVFGGGSPVSLYPSTRPVELTNSGGTITVEGPGPGNLVWSGNNQNAMFQVDRQAAVVLSGMTLSGGTSPQAAGGNGGAVSNAGSLTLVDDLLTGNSAFASGGAVYNTGRLVVNRCTFSANTSAQGGGISNIGGTLVVTNSTFSGNTAPSGAAVFNTGLLTITNGTVAANVAGQGVQVANSGAGRGTLNNTVLAGGAAGSGADLAGTFGGAYDLITDGTGGLSATQHNLLGSAANPIDARLAPLANYGGPTPTMPPLPGSPALAAGSPALAVDGGAPPAPLSTDQRGFPRVLSSRIDIGSVQTQANLVNTVHDAALGLGEWSLRSAVDLANANPQAGMIGFDPSVFAPGTQRVITLSSPLGLRGDATVNGPGAAILTITAPSANALTVEAASSVRISGLTFSNCTFEGAISNAGSLSISSCVLSNNHSYVSGAIVNTGNLTVQDTTFSGNHTENTGRGGAILSSGTLEVTRCTFSGNSAGAGGGAIASTTGSLVVTSSTFSGDSNNYDAGGILSASALTLTDCTFTNELGGPLTNTGTGTVARCVFANNPGFVAAGIANEGNLSLTDCTFSSSGGQSGHAGGIDNSGPGILTVRDSLFTGNAGAIYNQDTPSLPTSGGTVNVIDCTFSGNSGGLQGGAIFNGGTLNVSGSTFFKNSSSFQGGALANLGTANVTDSTFTQNSAVYGGAIDNMTNNGFNTAHLNLYNCTVVGNTASQGGGGIDQMVDLGPGVIMLWNTIVAGNLLVAHGTTTPSDIRGVCGGWNNLIGDGSGGLSARDHNLRGAPSALLDPKLGTLGDYGGSTTTMPPLPSSPAIDAGGNGFVPSGIIADQRGDYRIFNGAVDIGTVEYGSVPLLPGDADGDGTVAFADLLVMAQDYGSTNATFSQGDFNDDGSVGFDDLLLLAQNYGRSVALASAATLAAVPSPSAQTYTVTSLNDDGPGSLRDIIRQVNAGSAAATVTFAVTGTITLSSQLELSNDVTIQGPGSDLLQLNGNAHGRAFFVDSGVTASVSGVTVSGGMPQWGDYPAGTVSGGGIFNLGALTLANDVVSGNTAGMAKAYADGGVYDRAGNGGGVYNLGDLTVVNTTISGNVAGHGYNSPTSYQPTVGPGGSGGGVFAAVPITLTGSTLSGNTTGDGGMLPQGYGLNGAAEAGSGGGLYAAVPVGLFNCTVSGNSIGAGGLDYGYPDGSGIHADAAIQFTNVTISGNVGNGLSDGNAKPLLYNTIVAGNSGADFFGTLDPTSSHNLVGGNPLLAPLGWYGGPTQTMPPLPGSPALDAGSNALAVDGSGILLATDQRGMARIFNGTVDIGAAETQPGATAADLSRHRTVDFSSGLADGSASHPMWEEGDFTGDGPVAFPDLLVLAQTYGSAGPASSAASATGLVKGTARTEAKRRSV